MCNFRVSSAAYQAQFGGPAFAVAFARELLALEGFVQGGFASWDGELLQLSATGQFLARNMAMLFDTHLRGSEASTHRFSRTV
jgi:coproporphyrinogen III oxidase-like Fe-S oxidoreductase